MKGTKFVKGPVVKFEDLPAWKQAVFKALAKADKLSRQYSYTVIKKVKVEK